MSLCSMASPLPALLEDHVDEGAAVPAEGVRQAYPGVRHLAARLHLSAELVDDLEDLAGAGRADGVALGLEPAGGVDGDLAADIGEALLPGVPGGAVGEEAEALG